MNKLGVISNIESDFETRLYLCHDGFEFIGMWIIESLTDKTLLFPCFVIAHIYFLVFIIISWINTKVTPDE